MNTGEFLRTLFPLRHDETDATDLVRFVVVSRENPWPGTLHWRTRAELHALPHDGIEALGFDTRGKDVYVTPHAFLRRDLRVTKEDAAALGDACWVELDDPDLSPDAFQPPPSLVVATSPRRYHLYWLLASPQPTDWIQKTNWSLVYGNGVRIDKSGWALTKWLRLPGSVSYKRETPFDVGVVASTGAVYDPAAFADLPDAPALVTAGGRPAPPIPTPLDVAEIRTRYKRLPEGLPAILRREYPDRSAALWRAYNLCYHAGLSEEECYALLANTPNDKFHAEWRYNADDGLWRDICRGYHMANKPDDQPLPMQIDEIRGRKIPAPDKWRRIADLVRGALAERGRMYFDFERYEAYFVAGNRAIPMDATHQPWNSILYALSDKRLTKEDPGYKAINEHLYHTLALDEDSRVVPRSFAYWNTATATLYVYNGQGGVHRLDGETIDLVANGTDGVLFRDDPKMLEFAAAPPPAGSAVPSLAEAVFDLPNYADSLTVHSHAEASFIARTWFYTLFFGERFEARPHLILTGNTGSGKTVALKAMGELLKGPAANVTTLPGNDEQYKLVVANNRFLFFDNLDEETGRRWLMDALAETGTGIDVTRRVLYTNGTMITFTVRCFLGITTRNAWFTRADIANRSVTLTLERRDDNLDPTTLFAPIREHRNALWWELLSDLNKIIAALKEQPSRPRKGRLAGYADFVEAVCRATGHHDPTRILAVIEGTQSTSALDNSVIWQLLQPWLKKEDRDTGKRPNDGQWITAGRLFNELKPIARMEGMEREYERKIAHKAVFSRQLAELVPDLKKVIDVEVKKSTQGNKFWFKLREGVLAPDEEEAA